MNGEQLIHAERHRQINEEGWPPEQDDTYHRNELARAARCYMDPEAVSNKIPAEWPWDSSHWKPTTRQRNLEKAGALWLAEMDRRERAYESDDRVQAAWLAAMMCAEQIDRLDD